MPFTDTWDAAANLLPEEMSADQYQQEAMPAGCHAGLEPGRVDDFTKHGWEKKSWCRNYLAMKITFLPMGL